MGEYYWGRVEIGGDLRRQDLPRFCRELGATDEHDLPRFTEDGHIVLEDCDASYGQFTEVEDTCRELGLPYIRQSDGKYEFSPEIVFWQPGMQGAYAVITDHDHNMQVAMDEVREIRDLVRAGNAAEALCRLEAVVVDLPNLPPFRVA